jgi:RNA polymerase sigma-70 factor, ECF subfamily
LYCLLLMSGVTLSAQVGNVGQFIMTLTPETLDDLVRRAAGGDRRSLETLILHYHDSLLRVIKRAVTASPASGITPEDVLQETLLEAFRRIGTLDARGHQAFFGWLKTIADSRRINLIEAARAQKRGSARKQEVRRHSADSTTFTILCRIAGPGVTPSKIARKNEALRAVAKSLQSLDPLRRRILHLRFGKGLSFEEVATKTGKSEGAIKMLVNRALTELRGNIFGSGSDFSAGI